MKIYTYYEDIGFKKQPELIEQWSISWQNNGFDTEVLTREDAKKSSFFNEYYDFVQEIHVAVKGEELPDDSYWLASQLEIVAWHTIQQPSFVSDYDIINKNWKFFGGLPSKVHWRDHCCPCFASGDSGGWKRYIEFLLKRKDKIIEWCQSENTKTRRTEFGDQDFLLALYNKCLLSSLLSVVDISRHQDRICRHYDPDELQTYKRMQIYHLGHNPTWMVAQKLGYKHKDLELYRVIAAKEIIEMQK